MRTEMWDPGDSTSAGARRARPLPRRAARRLLAVLGAICALAAYAGAPSDPPEAPNPLDLHGWVSALWEPIASYGGDLGPARPHQVAVLLHRRDAVPGDAILPIGSRGLAIFELKPSGDYVRKALAERILPCVQCLGTFSRDPLGVPFDVDFEDGTLQIGWISNEDGLVAVRLTIGWDADRQAYALLADDVARGDPAGVRTRRIRDFVAGRQMENGRATEIEPRFVPLESVAADDYR